MSKKPQIPSLPWGKMAELQKGKASKSMGMSHLRVGALITVLFLTIAGLVSMQKLVENVSASQYVVIQSPVKGDLTWFTTPGVAWQGFGDVTSYDIRMKYDFREKGYAVQFNDGGHGTIYGSIQCDLPASHETLTSMHRKFPSQEQVENSLIKTSTESAIYLVGTLMSSRESYAEKKNDLIHYVTDQVQNGPYRTRQNRQWVKDPVTSQDKEIVTAEIMIDKAGIAERQEKSTLSAYGINCYQFTVNRITYDTDIEKQIKNQQAITMNVQTSVADKVLAEQRAQTAEAAGRANATEAKWRQETIKAQAVTEATQQKEVAVIEADRNKTVAETQASQRLTVAQFDKQAAEQTKAQLTLLGEGEGARKKAVLLADGALAQKLEAWQAVNFKYAETLRGAHLVPTLIMGGSGAGTQQSNAQDLLSLMMVKTARDLSLDLSVPGQPTK